MRTWNFSVTWWQIAPSIMTNGLRRHKFNAKIIHLLRRCPLLSSEHQIWRHCDNSCCILILHVELFCGVSYDDMSILHYKLSNLGVSNEQWIGKDMDGTGRALNGVTTRQLSEGWKHKVVPHLGKLCTLSRHLTLRWHIPVVLSITLIFRTQSYTICKLIRQHVPVYLSSVREKPKHVAWLTCIVKLYMTVHWIHITAFVWRMSAYSSPKYRQTAHRVRPFHLRIYFYVSAAAINPLCMTHCLTFFGKNGRGGERFG
jgi:hypothetical protein